MKICTRKEYLDFLATEGTGVTEVPQDRECVGVIQSVGLRSEVRAQVLYFKHADQPQFMIDVREVWPGKKAPRSLEDAAAG